MDTVLICFFFRAGLHFYSILNFFEFDLKIYVRESRKYMSGIVGRWWDYASTISSVLACPIIVACEQKPGKRWRSRHILGPTHSRPYICSTRTHFTRRTEKFLAETHGFLEHTFVTISINKCKAQTHWNYNVIIMFSENCTTGLFSKGILFLTCKALYQEIFILMLRAILL